MKTLLRLLLLVAMALHSYVSQGSTFKAKTVEGIEMTFKVTDETAKTCEVDSYAIDANISGLVTIPSDVNGYKVTGIGYGAFYRRAITSVSIPNSITSIGDLAFEHSRLTSVTIPNSVTKIGGQAFEYCSSLNEIAGCTKVEYIGGSAFDDTPWFDNLPDGMNYVGRVLLVYKGEMPSDTKISVAEGCTHICSQAFDSKTGLTELHLPSSLISIGSQLLNSCKKLNKITVDARNPLFDSRGDCNAIIETASNTLLYGCSGTTIPGSVKAIGSHAFNGILTWEEIVIPNNIDSIADYAFVNNGTIKSILIGKGLRKIGYHAFNFQGRLKEITVSSSNPYFDSRDNCNAIIETATNTLVVGCGGTKIPNTVKVIGEEAFAYNGYIGYASHDYISIEIPNSVEEIRGYAFHGLMNLSDVTIGTNAKIAGKKVFSSCKNIKSVISLNGFPDDILEDTFESEVYNNATLYVPAGCRNNYRLAAGWNLFKNIVDGIPSGIESVELAPSDNKSVFAPTGVRLSAPRKGINIINGRKVIVK